MYFYLACLLYLCSIYNSYARSGGVTRHINGLCEAKIYSIYSSQLSHQAVITRRIIAAAAELLFFLLVEQAIDKLSIRIYIFKD